MAEVYVGSRKLTDLNAQTANWTTSTLEVVSWKSQDGATVEGVLHKPIDFNPATQVPAARRHPRRTDRRVPPGSVHQHDIPHRRLGAARCPRARTELPRERRLRREVPALNVRNLGVGDAWDVLSGVDSLIGKGIVDPARVGTMGWSQGGYISAFLATHDAARFKAISVGAGISDWMTYYVNTDITPFTRQYLKATPWDDPEIYAKTSPITYIKQAKTPTLIQHGATDQRVPLPNAFELYHGLQDNHVPTKLIVYQGFGGVGHGPSKPKSNRATMEHNIEWFDQYLFGSPAKAATAQERCDRRPADLRVGARLVLLQPLLDRFQALFERAAGAALGERSAQAGKSTLQRIGARTVVVDEIEGVRVRRHRSQSPARCDASRYRLA